MSTDNIILKSRGRHKGWGTLGLKTEASTFLVDLWVVHNAFSQPHNLSTYLDYRDCRNEVKGIFPKAMVCFV